jgi:undecaprenyl diphosphate synthase
METNAMPLHVGIIMDGNGRWATQRNLPRTAGHREGLTAAKRIVAAAAAIGIRYLTFYTFQRKTGNGPRRKSPSSCSSLRPIFAGSTTSIEKTVCAFSQRRHRRPSPRGESGNRFGDARYRVLR